MKISKQKAYGVVTGDVVASTRLSSDRRKALHQAMATASRATRRAFRKAVPMDVDFFRGDGWQLIVSEPGLVLRVALFYRARLRALMESHRLDTRMAIAVGHIDFVPGDRVSQGDGEAYRLSGQGLEALPRAQQMSLHIPGLADEAALQVIVSLVDYLAAGWSDKQALAVTGALQGWTQHKIADTCWKDPITQQAVAQHLDRAGWNCLERALQFFEQTLAAHDPKKQ